MTFADTSWAYQPPRASLSTIPTLPLVGLSLSELELITRLQRRAQVDLAEMELCDRYYRGEQIIRQLGIALPKELQHIRKIVGWPRIAVDPYVERLSVDGFRIKGATDSDQELHDRWAANGLDAEAPLAFTDALSFRRSYWTVGSSADGGPARICAESPLNIAVLYGTDGRTPVAAMQTYYVDEDQHAAVYVPNETVHVLMSPNGEWQVTDRDRHNFGRVPVVRMANRPRTNYRDGYSEITPELRNVVDSACQQLVNLAVGGELYALPRVAILGATESDFQDAQGRPKTAWETYITKLLALERDENGDIPTIHQLAAYDPAVFTKVIEHHASQAAGILAAAPQDLGLYTDGNPTSAEAAAVYDSRRDRRARQMQATFGVALVEVMQLALRIEFGGRLPSEYERMFVDWADPSIETPGVTADAVTKYVAQGVLPARSDVTLKRARFTAVERARIAQDWAEQDRVDALAKIADEVAALGGGRGQQQVTSGDASTAG